MLHAIKSIASYNHTAITLQPFISINTSSTKVNLSNILHSIFSFTVIHSNPFCPKLLKLRQTPTSVFLHHRIRHIWIPPAWFHLLRPLIRPLIIIIVPFITGIILQIYKGQPPQWSHIHILYIPSHTTLKYTGYWLQNLQKRPLHQTPHSLAIRVE